MSRGAMTARSEGARPRERGERAERASTTSAEHRALSAQVAGAAPAVQAKLLQPGRPVQMNAAEAERFAPVEHDEATGDCYYTVQALDNLSAIAARLLGSAGRWREIWEANQSVIPDPGLIRAGMRLCIPGSAMAKATPGGPETTEQAEAVVATYTVRPGDTLSRIAAQVLGAASRWREIWEANRSAVPDPGRIRVGQTLVIPGADAAAVGQSQEPAPPTQTPNLSPAEKVALRIRTEQGELIEEQAAALGIEPAVAGAVLITESTGSGYGADGKMKIRFETHIFKKYTGETVANTHRGQAAEYDAFARAKAIDEDAAYKSISMGAAQIMGFNAQSIGYESAQEMFEAMEASERIQLLGFFGFVAANPKLVKAAQSKDWATFARIYNGPNYKANGYDTKMASYYRAYRYVLTLPLTPAAE